MKQKFRVGISPDIVYNKKEAERFFLPNKNTRLRDRAFLF